MIRNTEVESRYDITCEMERKCNLYDIAKCARQFGHGVVIEVITVKDESYHHKISGKHPKAID